MEKSLSLILALLMLICVPVPAFAGTGAELTCNASEAQLNHGDEVTITIALKNSPNAKSIALVFDYDTAEVFSLVGGEWLLTGAMLANFDTKTTACGTAAIAYASAANVNKNIFSLKLKVKDNAPAGCSVIKVTPVIKNDSTVIQCAEATVDVTIKADSSACTHTAKTYVAAKPSTAGVQGWDAYYACNNCGQLFASDGVTEIDEIPYLPLITVSDNATLSCSASSLKVNQNDEVTVTISLANVSVAKSVALVFDYDTSVFEPKSGEWLLTGAMLANFDIKTTACGTAAVAYASATDVNGDVFSLKLKVKETASSGQAVFGVSAVIKNDAKTIPCDPASIEFAVGSSVCQHVHKTAVEEKESECDVQGWAAYYYCDDCGQLFAKDGVTEIDEVPYYPFRQHSGGEATCKHLAVCDHCGKSYGSLDLHNHKGETEIRGKVEAGCTSQGYTGDIYCCDCGVKISGGSVINATGHAFSADQEYCLNGCGTKNPDYSHFAYLLGDVDGDGEVTILDATAIQRHLASLPTAAFLDAPADADEDGEVTILDATAIQRWLASLLSNQNIGTLM